MQTGPESLRILLVEDDEDDYLITRNLLAAQDRVQFDVEWANSYENAVGLVGELRHDVYLIDYRLGAQTGLDLVREALGGGERAPVILLTGQVDYEIDLEATLLGVTDFLVKEKLDAPLLERAIRYAYRHHSALQRLRKSEERYALAVQGANDGIWDWDLSEQRIYFGTRWKTMLGHGEADIGDQPTDWFQRIHPNDRADVQFAIQNHLAGHAPHFESEHRMRHSDGTYRWMFSRGVAIRDEAGTATRMAGSMSDITDRKAAEDQLVHDALHDSLTGLPNRVLFLDRLGLSLRRHVRQSDRLCAVAFLDLDRFKLVNDGFTHAIGDKLLKALGRRLSENLRPGDTVARLGGDEFTLLLEDLGSADEATRACARMQRSLREPFDIEGREVIVTASAGISISQPDSEPAEMMRNADIAMYEAKRQGAGRLEVFSNSMHRHVMGQLKMETELRRAIEDERLRVFYQPIVNLTTGRLSGFEALARWPADSQPVSPDDFIPVAEDCGLIGALGEVVLRTACEQLSAWRSRGLLADDVTMSVNVSRWQFADHSLVGHVSSALERSGLPAHLLRLEVTESTIMHDPAGMRDALGRLDRTGVRPQIDDFGTGYSSLTFLHHFPGDTLKIDRSFIGPMLQDQGSEEIVRTIIALAKNLGLVVVAEGVEHLGQAQALRALGCEYGQGFLWARALDAAQVEQRLAQGELLPVAAAGARP